jgi:thiol-disulfide isomerase/thioredoxin
MSSARQSIINRLRAGKEVDDWADLCIYPSGSLFVVELVPPDSEPIPGLTEEQATQLREDGELSEYCETPEEAADLYLMLEERFTGKLIAQKEVFRDSDESAPRRPRQARKSPELPALDEENIEDELREGIVVVLCWSPWSASDRLTLPMLARVAAAHEDVRFVTMDVAELPAVASAWKVASTPTAVVVRAGSLYSVVSPLSEDALRGVLDGLPR